MQFEFLTAWNSRESHIIKKFICPYISKHTGRPRPCCCQESPLHLTWSAVSRDMPYLFELFTSLRSLQPCSLGCEVKGVDTVRMLTEEKAQHNIILLWCCARRGHYELLRSIPSALHAETLSVISRRHLKKRLIRMKSCWVCSPNTSGWYEKCYYVSLQITPPKNIKNNYLTIFIDNSS